jgi:hypothetical protein
MKIMNSLLYTWFVSIPACTSTIQYGDYPASDQSKAPNSQPTKGDEKLRKSESSVEGSEEKHTEQIPTERDNDSTDVDTQLGLKLVKFTIPKGTGRGPWNSASNPIKVKQGQTLEVTNGDSQFHWVHTSFGPFPHPASGIAPGTSATYKISSGNARGVFDHMTAGAIYMEIIP